MPHTTFLDKWWLNDTKCIQLISFKRAWKENGIKPRLSIHTNGAKKKRGDTCFSFTIIIGYLMFNYMNWNLQCR